MPEARSAVRQPARRAPVPPWQPHSTAAATGRSPSIPPAAGSTDRPRGLQADGSGAGHRRQRRSADGRAHRRSRDHGGAATSPRRSRGRSLPRLATGGRGDPPRKQPLSRVCGGRYRGSAAPWPDGVIAGLFHGNLRFVADSSAIVRYGARHCGCKDFLAFRRTSPRRSRRREGLLPPAGAPATLRAYASDWREFCAWGVAGPAITLPVACAGAARSGTAANCGYVRAPRRERGPRR
jgi:hypothetical protein